MGFAEIIATVLMFIVIFYMGVMMTGMSVDHFRATKNAISSYQDANLKQIQTHIKITNASYETSFSGVRMHVKNTGSTILNPDYGDIYISGSRIIRNSSGRNMTISDELQNPGLWDPEETMIIDIPIVLGSGTYFIEYVTEYSIKDASSFTR